MRILVRGGGLIIDPSEPLIENGIVIVEGETIVYSGAQRDAPEGNVDHVIDCSNEIIMPAMIDSHLHAGEDSKREEGVLEQHNVPEALRGIRGYLSLQKDLLSGVTTVRLLGDGDGAMDKTLRDAINRGEITGPRILAAIQAIRPSHGTAPSIGVAADGVEEVRKIVRQTLFQGADVIKLFVSNLALGDSYTDYLKGDLTRVPAYTKEEISAAVYEAHNAGVKVAVHCIGGPALRWSAECGVDSIEHGNLLEEQDIEYLLKYNTYICDPNLHLFFDPDIGFESKGNKTHKWDDLPEWWHEKVRYSRKQTREVMGKALKQGVRFVLATDLNHGELWKEAKYFVSEIGATNIEALEAVTTNAAQLCGLEDQLGTLREGKKGDIITVKGNPLENITVLKDVGLVMKDGIVYKH